jgi:hypothetical protein
LYTALKGDEIMAERRMYSKNVVGTDNFLSLPLTAQALYFHLGIAADDDGFIINPITLMRMIGANRNDLDILIMKKYLIVFESEKILLTHWLLNNTIKSDRYRQTVNLVEFMQIGIDVDGTYCLLKDKNDLTRAIDYRNKKSNPSIIDLNSVKSSNGHNKEPIWNQSGTNLEPIWNHRIEKDSRDKISINKVRKDKKERLNKNSDDLPDIDNDDDEECVNEKKQYFKIFWKIYPKKIDEQRCEEFFINIVKKTNNFKLIIESLKRHLKSDQWNDSNNIPNPYDWLNALSWDNDRHLTLNIYHSKHDYKQQLDDICRVIDNSIFKLEKEKEIRYE